MKHAQLEMLRRLRDDLPFYASKCLKIVDKQSGQLVPFVFNRAQEFIHANLERQREETGKVRAVIVKGRQQGCSTLIAARFFHKATLVPGTSVFILAHIADSTDHLFDMAKKYYENAPPPILPTIEKMNERRLEFKSINSRYSVGTAGSANIGRAFTIRCFHGSEAAFWEKSQDIAAGVLQAVPGAPGTEIILESTANGSGNWFHEKAMSGLGESPEGDFRTIFVPWYWQPEYRKSVPAGFQMTDEEEGIARTFGLDKEQLFWRRTVIRDAFSGDAWRFKKEYPNTVEEGFLASGSSLVAPALVMDARSCKAADPFAPLVGGCDPARNRDRTVLVLRRGRQVVKWNKYTTMDEMTCAGIIATEIDRHNIHKFFVDVGCGYGTIDRLKELGYGNIVTGVHFGSTALQPDIFADKGSEMADAVRQWFEDGGANIPDDDEFQADILAIPPLRPRGSRGRLGLPPKDEIKKALGRSCDVFDALRLTFAYPVAGNAVPRIQRPPLDTRRPSSPLSTVRDFNRTREERGRTQTGSFSLT